MKRLFIALFVAGVAACSARCAFADQMITATFNSQGPYDNTADNPTVNLNIPNVVNTSVSLSQGGAMDWTLNSSTGGSVNIAAPVTNAFYTFCSEINQDIGFGGQYTYKLGSVADSPDGGSAPMGSAAAGLIAELWYRHYHDAMSSSTLAGAFQLAIWKIDYDGTSAKNGDFSTGDLTASTSDAIVKQASQWLTDLKTGPSTQAQIYALLNGSSQDQIVQAYSPTNRPFVTPEPGAIAMLLAGFPALGLVSLARRRRKAHAAVA